MGNNAAGTLGGAAGIASAVTPWAAPALGVANIGMSLLEASKQADLQKSAERAAEQAFSEQKRIQSQNFFEALRAPMEQYNKQREAVTAGGKQIMQAAQEAGTRETVGVAGKLFAGITEAESGITDKAGQALFDIGKLQAMEQGQTADDLAKMYETRVTGAQKAAATANKANIGLQNQAIAAGGGVITGLTGMIPEYSKTNQIKDKLVPLGAQGQAAGMQQMQQTALQNTNAFEQMNPAKGPTGFGPQVNPFGAITSPQQYTGPIQYNPSFGNIQNPQYVNPLASFTFPWE